VPSQQLPCFSNLVCVFSGSNYLQLPIENIDPRNDILNVLAHHINVLLHEVLLVNYSQREQLVKDTHHIISLHLI
jgi:hypothetical protein